VSFYHAWSGSPEESRRSRAADQGAHRCRRRVFPRRAAVLQSVESGGKDAI